MKFYLLLFISFLQVIVLAQTQDNTSPVITEFVSEVDVRNVDAGLPYYTLTDNAWNITATDNLTSSDKFIFSLSVLYS